MGKTDVLKKKKKGQYLAPWKSKFWLRKSFYNWQTFAKCLRTFGKWQIF